MQLNRADLEHRIDNFIGYGNLQGKFWFIGYEEGCSDKLDDIRFRLKFPGIQDIKQAHDKLANNVSFSKRNNPLKWFGDDNRFQRTWGTLIKILLVAKGNFAPDNTKGIKIDSELLKKAKKYQARKWGREESETLVADLLPLPSSSSSKWNEGYVKSGIEYLKSRSCYTQAIKDKRIELFKHLIAKYNPRVVIAYGKIFWNDFKKLSSSEVNSAKNKKFFEVYTNVVLIEHPVSGISNKEIIEIGSWIKDKL